MVTWQTRRPVEGQSGQDRQTQITASYTRAFAARWRWRARAHEGAAVVRWAGGVAARLRPGPPAPCACVRAAVQNKLRPVSDRTLPVPGSVSDMSETLVSNGQTQMFPKSDHGCSLFGQTRAHTVVRGAKAPPSGMAKPFPTVWVAWSAARALAPYRGLYTRMEYILCIIICDFAAVQRLSE